MSRSRGLELGQGLILPLDLATSSIAILGSSGSGKSNTSVRLFEQLVKNSIPAVGIDPKGDWWGIRSAGTAPGLSVPIFGGLRGDGPLEANMGQRLAELLVGERLSALLDVSRLSLGNRARFLIDFLHRLFELHQEDPHPRHIICEEAHRLIPQQIPKGETMAAQLKEAAARVVLEGRAFGLGFTAPSQRSARLNNDVLEEVRTLIVHRTGGPADQDAILRWVRHHHLREDVMATLAEMEDGNAWVWSPQYLKIVGRYQMCRRETFDSGATPKVGEVRRAARTVKQLALLTGQSAGGGSFNRRLTKLRQMELLAPGSPLVATEEGRRMGAAFTSPPPAAGPALLAYWKAKLPSGAARLLDAFVDAFPSSLSREQAAAAADYEAGGGAFNRMMAKLVALDLLYGAGRGLYRAAAELVGS